MLVYDNDMKLVGDFDGEFVYQLTNGEMLPYRIDGDLIYSTDTKYSAEIIGKFNGYTASLNNGEILFKIN